MSWSAALNQENPLKHTHIKPHDRLGFCFFCFFGWLVLRLEPGNSAIYLNFPCASHSDTFCSGKRCSLNVTLTIASTSEQKYLLNVMKWDFIL